MQILKQKQNWFLVAPIFLALLLACPAAWGEVIAAHDAASLAEALRTAKAGTTIRIAPGTYRGGHHLASLSGTETAPVTIEAADPSNPPVFSAGLGGAAAFHLAGCSWLTLRNLKAAGFASNGINADDGGNRSNPARGLRFEGLVIENTGPQGNRDALKLSGLTGFSVKGCVFAGWGGSAIDMVGCHEGRVEDCRFEGRTGFSQDNGVQMKGGSSRILVKNCFFGNAGQRAINLGGSTGMDFFRPADATWEARDIEVTGNRFTGSLTPLAWVGIDGGHAHRNTIYLPEKWVLRILQENTDPRLVRCRNGRFENNLIVFDRRVTAFANVGPNTQPESFTFRGNAWFCVDDPSREPRDLPAPETNRVSGVNPLLRQPGTAQMTIGSEDSRLKGVGAD